MSFCGSHSQSDGRMSTACQGGSTLYSLHSGTQADGEASNYDIDSHMAKPTYTIPEKGNEYMCTKKVCLMI